jgi:hypothetical protein
LLCSSLTSQNIAAYHAHRNPAETQDCCIGYPEGAVGEFEQLCKDFDVHVVERGLRAKVQPFMATMGGTRADHQVIAEIERLCAEQGPFEAAYILFANGIWAPMDEELCAAMWKNGNSMWRAMTSG